MPPDGTFMRLKAFFDDEHIFLVAKNSFSYRRPRKFKHPIR